MGLAATASRDDSFLGGNSSPHDHVLLTGGITPAAENDNRWDWRPHAGITLMVIYEAERLYRSMDVRKLHWIAARDRREALTGVKLRPIYDLLADWTKTTREDRDGHRDWIDQAGVALRVLDTMRCEFASHRAAPGGAPRQVLAARSGEIPGRTAFGNRSAGRSPSLRRHRTCPTSQCRGPPSGATSTPSKRPFTWSGKRRAR